MPYIHPTATQFRLPSFLETLGRYVDALDKTHHDFVGDEWRSTQYRVYDYNRYASSKAERALYLSLYKSIGPRVRPGKQICLLRTPEALSAFCRTHHIPIAHKPRMLHRLSRLLSLQPFLPTLEEQRQAPLSLATLPDRAKDALTWLTVLVHKQSLAADARMDPALQDTDESPTNKDTATSLADAGGIVIRTAHVAETRRMVHVYASQTKKQIIEFPANEAHPIYKDIQYTVSLASGDTASVSNRVLTALTAPHTILLFPDIDALEPDIERCIMAALRREPLQIDAESIAIPNQCIVIACTGQTEASQPPQSPLPRALDQNILVY